MTQPPMARFGMALLVYVPTSLPWLLAPTFFFVRGGSKCMTAPYRSAVMNQWFNKNRGARLDEGGRAILHFPRVSL